MDNSGWTPLHEAAKNGELLKCKSIIENLDNKNPTDDFGQTPLHLAAANGHLDVCKLIILTKITKVDREIAKTESQIAKLKKKYVSFIQKLKQIKVLINIHITYQVLKIQTRDSNTPPQQ